jgi:ubiquinone/menaquinone biosynthesis C-methylase UbiE
MNLLSLPQRAIKKIAQFLYSKFGFLNIQRDPEGTETNTLLGMVDFTGKRVLEVGAGKGRLTQRFAAHAAHVTGIDLSRIDIAAARRDLPKDLQGHVEFLVSSLEAFELPPPSTRFDIAILSWSL